MAFSAVPRGFDTPWTAAVATSDRCLAAVCAPVRSSAASALRSGSYASSTATTPLSTDGSAGVWPAAAVGTRLGLLSLWAGLEQARTHNVNITAPEPRRVPNGLLR